MKRWTVLALAGLALIACGAQPPPLDEEVHLLVPEVLAVYPHSPDAFTQGLVFEDGFLFESTGLYGASSLRKVVPETGEVKMQIELDDRFFGEGLALVGDRLIQLTWREGVAFVYDLETFDLVGEFRYDGEGWGLCFDGESLWMSDGSSVLTRRDPDTFAVLGHVTVTLRGRPLARLNELACIAGHVYANVFVTDYIVKVDTTGGQVVAQIDASNLLAPPERERLSPEAVLNGIAYAPDDDVFFLTGKLWPSMFKVRFSGAR